MKKLKKNCEKQIILTHQKRSTHNNILMSLKTYTLPVGPLQSNCVILYDDASKEGVIFDTGGDIGLHWLFFCNKFCYFNTYL